MKLVVHESSGPAVQHRDTYEKLKLAGERSFENIERAASPALVGARRAGALKPSSGGANMESDGHAGELGGALESPRRGPRTHS